MNNSTSTINCMDKKINLIKQQISLEGVINYIVTQDEWIVLDDNQAIQYLENKSTFTTSSVLVNIDIYIKNPALHNEKVGVYIRAHQEIEILQEYLNILPVIAFDFATFRDGRSYSKAYLLKTRMDYKGQIRAIGDVLRDQLAYMARCGFNAFVVRADKDINEALKAFAEFKQNYQADALENKPIYNR